MKQTATEYLFEKLWDSPKDKLTWNALLKQAKEMEEQDNIKMLKCYHDSLFIIKITDVEAKKIIDFIKENIFI